MNLELNQDPGVVVDALPSGAVSAPAAVLPISWSQLWIWGTRSALSIVDQGLVSGSSFLLNIVLARVLTKDSYGAFAVSFGAFLFLSGFHNVLVVEPLTVNGAAHYADRLGGYFSSQLRVHAGVTVVLVSIGLLASVALAMGTGSWVLASSIAALSIGLPFSLLFFVVRRMCYVLQSPGLALQSSGVYCVVLACILAVTWRIDRLTSASAFIVIAAASLAASLSALTRLPLRTKPARSLGAVPVRLLIRENWHYAHWLVLTTTFSWVSIQVQTLLTAGILQLSAAGALRAMQLPSLLISQVITAGMLLLLPSISREAGRGNLPRLHGKLRLVTMALLLFGLSFVTALYLCAAPIERILFRGKYESAYWLIPVLGLAPIFTGLASGYSYALRALGKSKVELITYTCSAVTAIVLAITLMPRWGLSGAAASIVGSTGILAAGVMFSFFKLVPRDLPSNP